MTTSMQEAFAKAMTKTQEHITQPIPAAWDDESDNAPVTEVHTAASKPAARVYFQVTNNVSRATFDFVRDNPGFSRVAATAMLVEKGFNQNSVRALLGQMVRQGLMYETNDALFVAQPEYTPIKVKKVNGTRHVRTAADVKGKAMAKPQRAAPRSAPQVKQKTQPAPTANTLPTDAFDAQKFVDGMTLKQAKAVYDVLSTVFRG